MDSLAVVTVPLPNLLLPANTTALPSAAAYICGGANAGSALSASNPGELWAGTSNTATHDRTCSTLLSFDLYTATPSAVTCDGARLPT